VNTFHRDIIVDLSGAKLNHFVFVKMACIVGSNLFRHLATSRAIPSLFYVMWHLKGTIHTRLNTSSAVALVAILIVLLCEVGFDRMSVKNFHEGQCQHHVLVYSMCLGVTLTHKCCNVLMTLADEAHC
jgi:hypothetical protein